TRVILTRLAALAVILLALSAIVFALEAMIPADPVRAMVGASATKEAVAAKRHELGLDKPLPVQYLRFLGRAATGNLSESLHTRRPVMTDLRAFLPATLELAGAAAIIAAVLGGLLGIATARGRASVPRLLMLAGASAPPFLLALALLMLFYARWHVLPSSGPLSPGIMPPSGPTGLLVVHALRSALDAPLTVGGLQVGLLLAGVVVIESVFAWPGVGLYTVQSIASTDFPAVAGVTLVLGALYVVINALVDLAQVVADPRLRAA